MAKEKRSEIVVPDTSAILRVEQALEKMLSISGSRTVLCSPVMDELDDFKKGDDLLNKIARNAVEWFDKVTTPRIPSDWFSPKGVPGKLRYVNFEHPGHIKEDLNFEKVDHKIIWIAIKIQRENPQAVVCILSNDKNLRARAKGFGLEARQYFGNDENGADVEKQKYKHLSVSQKHTTKLENGQYPEVKGAEVSHRQSLIYNQPVFLRIEGKDVPYVYDKANDTFILAKQRQVCGIKAKNDEQRMLFQNLLDPRIRLVLINGVTGSGKTLLSLASGLEQAKSYNQILVARPIVALGNKDIGYMPGDAKMKVDPFMQPIWDNFRILQEANPGMMVEIAQSKKPKKNEQVVATSILDNMVKTKKLEVQPLAFLRGRSLGQVYFIVDEAQNLTPLEAKTIVTRAGENSKIIFTGDIKQIDSPYLEENSNGLAVLMNRLLKSGGDPTVAIHNLLQGERSHLANLITKIFS